MGRPCGLCGREHPTWDPSADPVPLLTFTYRNWRGEVAIRRVRPLRWSFASTSWHPEPQWLLVAWDEDKQAERSFAFRDIISSPHPNFQEVAMPETFPLVALHDRVIVRRVIADTQTPGGLFVPEPARERPQVGVVVAVGPGDTSGSTFVATTVTLGEQVYFGRFAHDEIEHDGETYLVLRERDILAVRRVSAE